jgi:hypothetical protein
MGERVTRGDAEAVGRVAEEHPRAGEVGAAVLEALSRQAEGRRLFAGEEFVRTLVERHGLSMEDGETALGNVFAILAAGPASQSERGVVLAFTAKGLERRLEKDLAQAERELSAFVRQADWLETSTEYAVHAHLDALLPPEHRRTLHRVIEATVLEDARESLDTGARGRIAVRLAALFASEGPEAKAAFERIAEAAGDPVVRQSAAGLLGRGARTVSNAELVGEVVPFSARGFVLRLLRWITGWALLMGVLRFAGWCVGLRRSAVLSLVESRLGIVETTRFLGRVVSEKEAVIPLYAITRLERQVRFPALVLAVGVLSLALGILVGGTLLADGVRSGETVLLLVGAALLAGGVVLDVALEALFHGMGGRVLVDLTGHSGVRLRLRSTESEAGTFLREVRAALSRTRTTRGAGALS